MRGKYKIFFKAMLPNPDVFFFKSQFFLEIELLKNTYRSVDFIDGYISRKFPYVTSILAGHSEV